MTQVRRDFFTLKKINCVVYLEHGIVHRVVLLLYLESAFALKGCYSIIVL